MRCRTQLSADFQFRFFQLKYISTWSTRIKHTCVRYRRWGSRAWRFLQCNCNIFREIYCFVTYITMIQARARKCIFYIGKEFIYMLRDVFSSVKDKEFRMFFNIFIIIKIYWSLSCNLSFIHYQSFKLRNKDTCFSLTFCRRVNSDM